MTFICLCHLSFILYIALYLFLYVVLYVFFDQYKVHTNNYKKILLNLFQNKNLSQI